jgi:hypothetical protein
VDTAIIRRTSRRTKNVATRSSQEECKENWDESLDDSCGCSALFVVVVVVGVAETWGDAVYGSSVA